MKVSITGVGAALPERVVTNEELAPKLGVTTEWIEKRSGILERRYAAEDESASSLGSTAALEAIAHSGHRPEDIATVIVATCTPDYLLPATASIVQDKIGATNAAAFDLAAACSGFIYSISVAASLISAANSGPVVIIGSDLLSRHIDPGDALTAPLFGDAAAAVVLEADPSAEPLFVQMGSDGSGLEQVLIPGGGSKLPEGGLPHDPSSLHLKMFGREVFRNAVRVMSELGESYGADAFDLMVAHQANKRILDACAKEIGIGPDKVYMNLQRYGNTSAASIPLALWEAWKTGRLDTGDRLLMLAFGAGYTWGSAALRWTIPSPASAPKAGERKLADAST